MILFDAMFLASLFAMSKLGTYFAQLLFVPQPSASLYMLIILTLIYYLIILIAYSFFKYCVLDFIKSLFGSTSFSFRRLDQFCVLNIMISAIFFAIMLVFNVILSGIKESFAPFIFVFLAVPYLLILYLTANISQSLFYQESSAKISVKKGLKIIFTNIKSYRETILIMILFALFFGLLFLGGGYLIRTLTSKNYSLYLALYSYSKKISIIIFEVALYVIILINRISFYSIANQGK